MKCEGFEFKTADEIYTFHRRWKTVHKGIMIFGDIYHATNVSTSDSFKLLHECKNRFDSPRNAINHALINSMRELEL